MYNTRQKIRDCLDYRKLPDGSWQIDFRGFTMLTTRAKTLDACQAKILDEIDSKLADFVAVAPETAKGGRRRRVGR